MTVRTDVKIVDTATPFLRKLEREFPDQFDRALKSSGWWLRKEIKAGIRSGAPGGRSYKPYSEITASRRLDAMRGRGRTKTGRWRAPRRRLAQHRPMGRLYQATRYKFWGDSKRVIIGWISRSAERLGTLQEEGGTIRVTPRMRRFFWAAGIPMSKNKQYIRIPKRPTIEPEYRENAPKIRPYIEDKVMAYLRKAESR